MRSLARLDHDFTPVFVTTRKPLPKKVERLESRKEWRGEWRCGDCAERMGAIRSVRWKPKRRLRDAEEGVKRVLSAHVPCAYPAEHQSQGARTEERLKWVMSTSDQCSPERCIRANVFISLMFYCFHHGSFHGCWLSVQSIPGGDGWTAAPNRELFYLDGFTATASGLRVSACASSAI